MKQDAFFRNCFYRNKLWFCNISEKCFFFDSYLCHTWTNYNLIFIKIQRNIDYNVWLTNEFVFLFRRSARGKKITFQGYLLKAYWTDCNISCHTNIRKKTKKEKAVSQWKRKVEYIDKKLFFILRVKFGFKTHLLVYIIINDTKKKKQQTTSETTTITTVII